MTDTANIEQTDLERKFSETAFSLNQERSDFLLPQVLDFVRDRKWVNLRPEYQRRLVWDDSKRSLFIESLLLNVPIPPVFLYEWDLSRYEVMDGQQRLNSIVDFYRNAFALKGLERWREINGLHYNQLPETLQRGLDRRRISATVLLVQSSAERASKQDDIRKLVFERLNTGGQHLNAQELRNCLFAGNLNDALIELSSDKLFTQIWEIPPHSAKVEGHRSIAKTLRENPRYRRMEDCEIVLRFFAFRDRSNIRGSVRSMLDRWMGDHRDATASELKGFKEDFRTRLAFAHKLFGQRTFRYKDQRGEWMLSKPLYDAVMVAIDRLWPKHTEILISKSHILERVERLLARPSAFEVIVGRPNTANAVSKRMKLITKAIRG